MTYKIIRQSDQYKLWAAWLILLAYVGGMYWADIWLSKIDCQFRMDEIAKVNRD